MAIANPKAFAAIGAVYSGTTVIPGELVHDALLKIAILTLVIVLVNGLWLVLGAAFASMLRNSRMARPINIGFAVLLIASVGMAAYAS